MFKMQAVTLKGQCQKTASQSCSFSVLGKAAEGARAHSSIQASVSPAGHVRVDPGAQRGPFRLAEKHLEWIVCVCVWGGSSQIRPKAGIQVRSVQPLPTAGEAPPTPSIYNIHRPYPHPKPLKHTLSGAELAQNCWLGTQVHVLGKVTGAHNSCFLLCNVGVRLRASPSCRGDDGDEGR